MQSDSDSYNHNNAAFSGRQKDESLVMSEQKKMCSENMSIGKK